MTRSPYAILTEPCEFLSGGTIPVSYTPPVSGPSRLDWFGIARCARLRMQDKAGDIEAWRGERRSFYTAIQKMDADSVTFLD